MIYFNTNNEAICGEPPTGYTGPTLTDEEWHKYASAPNVNYKIEDGKFVPLRSVNEIENEKIAKSEIAELKQKLKDTDYMAIKYAEGQITESEYAEIKTKRQEWRNRINQIE